MTEQEAYEAYDIDGLTFKLTEFLGEAPSRNAAIERIHPAIEDHFSIRGERPTVKLNVGFDYQGDIVGLSMGAVRSLEARIKIEGLDKWLFLRVEEDK